MPWYVYAIHKDETGNRRYHEKSFATRADAEPLYRDMAGERVMGDNYRVEIFSAADDVEAEAKANAMRRYPK